MRMFTARCNNLLKSPTSVATNLPSEDGAAPLVKNPDILTVAVRFHTVEAEHATTWRFLLGQDPVPFAFAPPLSMAEVLEILNPFLKGTATM